VCGIAAASGPNAARLSILLTLGQLERGTEGTGIAYISPSRRDSRICVIKEPVNPIMFAKKHFIRLDPRSVSAVAHNRMPSRGNVSYVNTHPFVSCSREFAIVHNGTVFFKKSTIMRMKKSHKILGDTDSEIVCHLIEQYYNIHADMITALSELLDTEFSGSVLVLMANGEIYGLRKGLEPIHFAQCDGNVLVASTEKAIRNIVAAKANISRLKSGQILRIRGTEIRTHDTDHVDDDALWDFVGTQYACDWRSYFRSAKTLKYFF
jgi:glucosamine--fructose-6-phosphate aminotransferase (isomerizing)